jgi:subtilisin family serine protease
VKDGALSGKDRWILDGITWTLDMKVDIVCLAFTGAAAGPGYSAAYERLAERALAQGTLILAAAGNASHRPDRVAAVGEPANCPSILAVTAIDRDDRVAMNANAGLHPNGGDIGLAAPGVNVDSIWRYAANRAHARHSGTSQAAAFAAGVAALHAEALPEARGEALWKVLRRTARRIEPFEDFGFGLVQAP